MNQPVTGRIGVPGGGAARAGTPGTGPGTPPIGVPGGPNSADTDGLLHGVEDELNSLDQLETADQVVVFDRVHAALAEALARTADTGTSPFPGPAPGQPGA